MKTNKEIRAAARAALFRTRCGARAMSAMLILGLVCSLALLLLQQAFVVWGVQTLDRLAFADGRPFAALPGNVLGFAALATLFAAFVHMVFGGIQNFGWSVAALRGTRQDEQGLFRAVFSGFRNPFGMFGLMFGYVLRLLLSMLPLACVYAASMCAVFVFRDSLLAHPAGLCIGTSVLLLAMCIGLVPVVCVVYRCRFVWFLRMDHPEWRGGRCFLESARMMNGRKWRAFRLDCSYWRPFVLLFLLAFAGAIPWGPLVLRTLAVGFVLPVAAFFVSVYFMFGQARFYEDARGSVV